MIIYNMKVYFGSILIYNLKWGRKDVQETLSGSYYNRGYHNRFLKTALKQPKKD